ncbi:MAG TPA: hypothetical protein VGG34_10025 [Opitutaceae bacterium]
MNPPKFPSGGLAAIAAAATALVILLGGLARQHLGSEPRFPLEQANVGYSLAAGLGYSNPFGVRSGPTAWVPPAFPLLYAGAIETSKATGFTEGGVIAAVNMAAAAAAVWLVLAFCTEGFGFAGVAVFCAAFAAYGILDSDFLVSTGAVTAAETALFIAGMSRASRIPAGAAGLGMVFAAGALLAATHPGLALGAVVVAAGWACGAGPAGGTRVRAALPAAALAAGILAATLPWMLRNHRVFGEWIPSKSNGYFELVLSQDETRDGVLTAEAIVAGHPSTNPRLLASYVGLGERRFLDPYRTEARRIMEEEPGSYVLFCLDRLFNALCLCASPSNIEVMHVHVAAPDAARLVGRRLALVCSGVPELIWPRQAWGEKTEHSLLVGAGVSGVDSLERDWARAQSDIESQTQGRASVLAGLAWSGLPTCLLLAAVLLALRSPPRLVLVSAVLYLVALAPNVLITHDERHQANFSLLFSVFSMGAWEALRRRRPAVTTQAPGGTAAQSHRRS